MWGAEACAEGDPVGLGSWVPCGRDGYFGDMAGMGEGGQMAGGLPAMSFGEACVCLVVCLTHPCYRVISSDPISDRQPEKQVGHFTDEETDSEGSLTWYRVT